MLTIFAERLVILRLTRQLCASARPGHVLLLTIFARRLVTLRLIRRHKDVFFKTLRIDTSSMLTIFAQRLVILRLI